MPKPFWFEELVEEVETTIMCSPLGEAYVKLLPEEIEDLRTSIAKVLEENIPKHAP